MFFVSCGCGLVAFNDPPPAISKAKLNLAQDLPVSSSKLEEAMVPKFISPLDDMYIRFDAAAELLARTNQMSTAGGMLEMLTIAMWQGAFNPPSQFEPSDFDHSTRDDPENWLCIPIPMHASMLPEAQGALKPRPVEFFEVGRSSVLSVMHCEGLLPGDQTAWNTLLDHRNSVPTQKKESDAFAALIQTPLRDYSAESLRYLRGIFVPRRMLQKWLNRRSNVFDGIIDWSETEPLHRLTTQPANDAERSAPRSARGRPSLPAWDKIEVWAQQLHTENPGIQRKQLAGLLYDKALKQFNESAVPNETTILRRLGRILNGSSRS